MPRQPTPWYERALKGSYWTDCIYPELGQCLISCHAQTQGYPMIGVATGRPYYLNRLSLERKIGRPLASNEWALHRCDTPACWNPEHLYVGDRSQNARDMHKRGRSINPDRDPTDGRFTGKYAESPESIDVTALILEAL